MPPSARRHVCPPPADIRAQARAVGQVHGGDPGAQPPLPPPELRRLPREGGARAQPGEPGGPVGPEVMVDVPVAVQPDELADQLHSDDLSVRQRGAPAPLTEPPRIFFHHW